HVGLLTSYAGLLAAAPHFSFALSLRSGTVASQKNTLSTNLFASGQDLLRTTTYPTADDRTKECLATINELRSENLKGLLRTLAETNGEEVTESLTTINVDNPASPTADKVAVKLAGEDVNTCASGKDADAKTYPGLVIPFTHETQFNCSALIQAAYTAGLNHLKQSNFEPSTGAYNAENVTFNNVNASNVAFLLSEKSKKVSCAAAKDCKAGYNVFCYFIEPLRTGDKPFTLYNALWGLETGAAFISVSSVIAVLVVFALIIRT
ncbi:SAG family member, partial [Eimeria tenella]